VPRASWDARGAPRRAGAANAPRRGPRCSADASSERAPCRGPRRAAGARRPRALGPSRAGEVHRAEAAAGPRPHARGLGEATRARGNRAGDELVAPAPRRRSGGGLRRLPWGLRAIRAPAAHHGQPGREGGREGGERGGTHRGTRPSEWTRRWQVRGVGTAPGGCGQENGMGKGERNARRGGEGDEQGTTSGLTSGPHMQRRWLPKPPPAQAGRARRAHALAAGPHRFGPPRLWPKTRRGRGKQAAEEKRRLGRGAPGRPTMRGERRRGGQVGRAASVAEPPKLFRLKCLSPALEARPHLNRNNT
jgi:hypothetical protein